MDDKEIKEALNNIKELKELVENKNKRLQPVIFSKLFIKMLFYASLLLLITTILIAFGYFKYPTFSQFPILYKGLIFLSIIINFIFIFTKKMKAFSENTQIPIVTTLDNFYSIDFIISVILAVFFTVLFAYITKLNWVYLPLLTVFYGLLIIYFSNTMKILEFKYMGYITIFIGTISMLFLQIPLLLLGFSMYTIIFFCYYLLLKGARRKTE
ncbi:MAG: hypothetical protein ACPKM0_11175 [Pleomorphochaeta sp.]